MATKEEIQAEFDETLKALEEKEAELVDAQTRIATLEGTDATKAAEIESLQKELTEIKEGVKLTECPTKSVIGGGKVLALVA